MVRTETVQLASVKGIAFKQCKKEKYILYLEREKRL